MGKNNKKIKIDPNIGFTELMMEYPKTVEILQEYGMHCIGCPFASFETLEQGAHAHGIEGKDFEEMIKELERVVNAESDNEGVNL